MACINHDNTPVNSAGNGIHIYNTCVKKSGDISSRCRYVAVWACLPTYILIYFGKLHSLHFTCAFCCCFLIRCITLLKSVMKLHAVNLSNEVTSHCKCVKGDPLWRLTSRCCMTPLTSAQMPGYVICISNDFTGVLHLFNALSVRYESKAR